MDAQGVLAWTRDVATIGRLFGEPIERDGVTVIPVAAFAVAGLVARPAGVYVIKDGTVTWQAAIDVTGIARGGQIVGIVALLVLRTLLKRRGRGRRFGRKHR